MWAGTEFQMRSTGELYSLNCEHRALSSPSELWSLDFAELVSTAFDAHVTDQTLTGSAGDRSATRRQLRELAAASAIDDNDDVKCLDEITGRCAIITQSLAACTPDRRITGLTNTDRLTTCTSGR